MGGTTIVNHADEEYLASKRWLCAESPTNAHHWVGLDIYQGDYQLFVCKYCSEPRMMPRSYLTALAYTRKKADKALERFTKGV